MYFLKTSDDAIEKARQFFADIGKPGTLVCDGASEINLNEIKQLCIKQGVRLELSAPYTPEEKSKVERNWGKITSMARCLIEQSGIDKTYWPYAINMSNDIKNFCYHSGIKRTPLEAKFGQTPNLESLKMFGCTAYVHIEKSFRRK